MGLAAPSRRPRARSDGGHHRQPHATFHPESGTRAGYDGAKRKRGSKVHLAVDTLGHLLTLHVTPADVGDRAAVGRLCADIQDATDEEVQLAYVDQG